MASYYPHGFTLSDEQLRRVASGQAIRLKHENLSGSDQIYMTKPQITKINKARQAGKGIQLQLSLIQLQHQTVHGNGRFTDILKKLGNFVRPVAQLAFENNRDGIERAGTQATKKVMGKVGRVVKDQFGGDQYVDALLGMADGLSTAAWKKLMEAGSRTINGGCACREVFGHGLFATGKK